MITILLKTMTIYRYRTNYHCCCWCIDTAGHSTKCVLSPSRSSIACFDSFFTQAINTHGRSKWVVPFICIRTKTSPSTLRHACWWLINVASKQTSSQRLFVIKSTTMTILKTSSMHLQQRSAVRLLLHTSLLAPWTWTWVCRRTYMCHAISSRTSN